MAKLTNQGVISAFLNGLTGVESHTGNLWISADGTKLMNYATCLVQHHPEYKLIINKTKYSSTTSKIQNYIQRELDKRWTDRFQVENIYTVEQVQIGSSSLVPALEKHIKASQFEF
jgi:hypothetical protein